MGVVEGSAATNPKGKISSPEQTSYLKMGVSEPGRSEPMIKSSSVKVKRTRGLATEEGVGK